MPVRMDDVEVTQDDVTASMRRDNLKRVDRFIRTASEQEAKKIRGWSEHRLLSLGAIQPKQKPKKTDRVFARLAVESVPILLTLLVVTPLVIVGVMYLLYGTALIGFTQYCPPACNTKALILWAMVVAIGLMVIILAYHSLRKLMIRART